MKPENLSYEKCYDLKTDNGFTHIGKYKYKFFIGQLGYGGRIVYKFKNRTIDSSNEKELNSISEAEC